MEFRVEELGFRALGSRVKGLGFGIHPGAAGVPHAVGETAPPPPRDPLEP